MVEQTLRVLEYDKIVHILARLTATVPGRRQTEALRPLAQREEIEISLAEISECTGLLEQFGSPPLGGAQDLAPALQLLRAEGTWLQPEALLDIRSSIEAARDSRLFFLRPEMAPRLAQRSEGLNALKGLLRQLSESIGPRGEILDGASFELADLRRSILQLRARIRRTLEAMLSSDRLAGAFQDRIVTERNGRYVLPVRADHRGQVKGFVHDESASGQTLYIEPAAVLEANNDLQSTLREEKREEERILKRLSEAVRQHSDTLRQNQQIMARLDFVAAAGRLSRMMGATSPKISREPRIELKGARHPLLLVELDGSPRQQEAVPVDLLMGPETEALVISGPNTGGKTVAIKTVGLLTLMVSSGLHIPCLEGSQIHLFGRVFADIGDDQSIEENLSTFSGHLVRTRRILEEADSDSLVLLDEAGTGTDPAEGGALAMAVLDSLRGRGTRVVLTTHLNLLKSYAYLEKGVENAAVEFDSQTLAPTYRLHYGIPGASSAFTIARGLGLPEAVLEGAARYLGEGERKGLDLIEELNRLHKEQVDSLYEARRLRRQAQDERQKRRELLRELEAQKEKILSKARQRGEKLVLQTEKQLQQLFDKAGEATAGARQRASLTSELKGVRQSVTELKPEPQRRGVKPGTAEKGEILRVPALGTEGEVVRLQGRQVELLVQGKKLRLPLESLEAFKPRRFKGRGQGEKRVRSEVVRESFQTRLMLVGRRVDEALPLVERLIDDALLHNQRQIEIVHGAGEGILRRAVRDLLRTHREVKAFHAADIAFGGDNVTVVELRD